MKQYRLLTGGYTAEKNQKGLRSLLFDGKTVTEADASDVFVNPSYLLYDTGFVYTAEERSDGAAAGRIAIDAAGRFRDFTRFAIPGTGICHIEKHGAVLYAAGYHGGNITAYTAQGDIVDEIWHTGSSINTQRQESAHVHSCLVAPEGRYLVAADLGTDRLYKYAIDPKTGRLRPADKQPQLEVPAGAGPRHFAFDRQRRRFYLVCELSQVLYCYAYHPESMVLTLTEEHLLCDNPEDPVVAAADIHVSPDQNWLFASVRGTDQICAYRISPQGKLWSAGRVGCGGKGPRNFAISPDGRYLAVANQLSGSLNIFTIEYADQCKLIPAAVFMQPQISCIKWYTP